MTTRRAWTHRGGMLCLVVTLMVWLSAVPGFGGWEEGERAYESGDYATAIRAWLPLAQQGHAEAQYQLGKMTIDGQGVRKDRTQGAQWLRRAAEQGHITAQFELGLLHAVGLGVPQDAVQAAQWYQRAATQGDARAQYAIGSLYYEGRGVPQNYLAAYMWLTLAAAYLPTGKMRDHAVQTRDDVASRMSTDQLAQAQERARTWQPKREGGTQHRP